MANIDHIMPNPVVIPIFWGHAYVANPGTADSLKQMLFRIDEVAGYTGINVKVRYRGLAKYANRLFATCALVNLYMVRRKLLYAAA